MDKESTRTQLRHQFDYGGPLYVPDDGSDPEHRDLAVGLSFCDNPDCPCREINLGIWVLTPDGTAEMDGPEHPSAELVFDVDTGALKVPEGSAHTDRAIELAKEVERRWLPDHSELAVKRWQRARRWILQRSQPPDLTGYERGDLVPYAQAFPDDWDLAIELDQELYWFVDNWCIEPRCRCDEVRLDVLDSQGKLVGWLRAGLSRWRILEAEGGQHVAAIWKHFIQHGEHKKLLRERRRRLRQAAAEHFRLAKGPVRVQATSAAPAAPPPAFAAPSAALGDAAPPDTAVPAVSTPRVGRNEACPCGSGKKYKRCCGA